MRALRIVKSKRANDLSGTGAALYPGRWNKKGIPVLYAGENPEIALLELVVNTPPAFMPKLVIITLDIPDDLIMEIDSSALPKNWMHFPAPSVLAEIGQQWIDKGCTVALKVPNAIIHTSFNYLLNCNHPDFSKVKIIDQKPFRFDTRLVK